ncbi:metallophosphoesterase family protein [Sporanaerobacter acetigenes]|uniref:Calcineurin-like phosphoesterase n=2 Tax=Sporanaerobacter acetigenes TaxID=165813 RepID=A0A1M5XEM8_9FIRM|nr:metallophosphoesterase family protein [Sporanaerobacter acetigenes]SHH97954.1 Calcineurin-like phosphoesterase [Sporanaerobacter acetigenes DSM 13106]
MKSYMDVIDFINNTKLNLENQYYSTGEELKKDFFKINSLVWKDLNDLFYEDLSNVYEIHKYLVDEVCKIHEEEYDDYNSRILKENINIKKIENELKDGKRAFNIYSLNEEGFEYYLIGDIHSDTISIKRVLEKVDFFNRIVNKEKIRLVFLGDYVDRGKKHLECLQYILSLKYIFSENVYILRGNHDGGSIKDGEVVSWVRVPEEDDKDDWFYHYLYHLTDVNKTIKSDIIEIYSRFFDSLCNIVFICNKNIVMATHGGLPRYKKDRDRYYYYINSISDLTNKEIVDNLNKTIVDNMMWSDLSINGKDLREDNGRFRFSEEHFEEFKDLIGFDLFVRGHEAEFKGYHKFFNDSLITIFSSGIILENDENINRETAYKSVEPKILKVDEKSKISIIDINK